MAAVAALQRFDQVFCVQADCLQLAYKMPAEGHDARAF